MCFFCDADRNVHDHLLTNANNSGIQEHKRKNVRSINLFLKDHGIYTKATSMKSPLSPTFKILLASLVMLSIYINNWIN